MAQTIKILVAEANLNTRIGLKKLLFQVPPESKPILRDKEIEIAGEAESFKDVEILTAKLSPDIVLMSTNLKDIGGVDAACRIAYTFPVSSVIIISEHSLTQDELKKAMVGGVRSFLVQPVDQLELHKVIVELFEINSQKRQSLETITTPVLVVKSKIIAMFGAKGGVGRTLVSTNLAVFMAEYLNQKNKKVALIDLDLQFGDVAIMLNLTPAKTITGLSKEINELGNIDEELLESYLIKYRDKLAVLPAPLKPEEAELVKGEHIEKILDLIRRKYNYTIIDCSRILSEPVLVALSAADVIVLLLTLDIPTIKNAKLALEVMEKLGFGPKVKIVVNRANTKMGITIAQVKEALASPIMELIPSNGCVAIPSVNEGVPFIIKSPKSNISKSITKMADKLIERVDKIKPKKWWK
ncbi:MAG: AAA family ATPase [bacterium]